MNIITTINLSLFNNPKQALEILNMLDSFNISKIRINIKNFNEKNLRTLKNVLSFIDDSFRDKFFIYIDLPIPREKYRILNYIKRNDSSIVYIISDNNDCNDENRNLIFMPKEYFYTNTFNKNNLLYYADGQVAFLIEDIITSSCLKVKMLNRNDININKSISSKVLYEKQIDGVERQMLQDLVNNKIGIFLSFVNNEKDILNFKELFNVCCVYAKIEDSIGLSEVDNISKNCEGLIIARGDLSLNLNPKELWTAHEKINEAAKKNKKEVFAATNIFPSLTYRYYPTSSDIIELSFIKKLFVDSIILSANQLYNDFPNLMNHLKEFV